MRSSKFKQAVAAGRMAKLAALYFPNDIFMRHAAHAGFDVVWIEAEHHMWEPRELQRMMYLGYLADIDVFIRPATREKAQLYQLLENGASGVIIPQVSNAQEARHLVQCVKFPPIGERGLDGAGLDADFYLGISKAYPVEANKQITLFVQIENLEGLAKVDEIASVAGVDGIFIGPGDLSMRLDSTLDPEDPKLLDAQAKVAAAAQAHGILWGRPCFHEADIAAVQRAGAGFANFGSDFFAVANHLKESGAALDRVITQR